MRLDGQNIFSDAQAITSTAASTYVVQLSNGQLKEVAFGHVIPLLIQVVQDFATLTSLTVAVQTDDNESFSSPTTLLSSTLALSALKTGKRFPIIAVPAGNEKYMRMYYTVTGSNATAGKITAVVVDAIDNSYQDM